MSLRDLVAESLVGGVQVGGELGDEVGGSPAAGSAKLAGPIAAITCSHWTRHSVGSGLITCRISASRYVWRGSWQAICWMAGSAAAAFDRDGSRLKATSSRPATGYCRRHWDGVHNQEGAATVAPCEREGAIVGLASRLGSRLRRGNHQVKEWLT
ncbi:MAG TPA: hypothetical protein VN969_43865 [Streptosporangiaceae bacterium]|nr:hypothetical protein [Streptosporangiaceae bacterium]